MSQRDSPLYNFIMDALMDNKYPVLFWINQNEGIFCLKCLPQSNRNWTPEQSQIFEDYHNLKPRNSDEKRQRFLIAMKSSPYIEHLEEISTREEKYYRFKSYDASSVDASDVILASSNKEVEMPGIPIPKLNAENGPLPVDATVEIATSASNDVEMSEITLSEMHTINGLIPGDPCIEDHLNGSEVGSCLSPILADSNDSLPEDLHDPQIFQLLQRLESYVPDAAASVPESPGIGASPSLYDDQAHMMRSSPSCSQTLGSSSSDQWNLPAQELREENNYPLDYDHPAEDFLISWEPPKPAERESAVPGDSANVPESSTIGTSLSLYDDSSDMMRSSASCIQAPGSSDSWGLPGEELSYSFEAREENDDYPLDYDPEKDLLESLGTRKPAETSSVILPAVAKADANVLAVPGSLGESATCQSVKIVRLDDNDGFVRSLRGNNSGKKFFMMELIPRK